MLDIKNGFNRATFTINFSKVFLYNLSFYTQKGADFYFFINDLEECIGRKNEENIGKKSRQHHERHQSHFIFSPAKIPKQSTPRISPYG